MATDDRHRGVLSQADREYLRGESAFDSESGTREVRRRIRERVRNALVDFALLFEYMEERDREQVLDKFVERSDRRQLAMQDADDLPEGPPELLWDAINPDSVEEVITTGGLGSTQDVLLLLFYERLVEGERYSLADYEAVVEDLVADGLGDALGKKGRVADIKVEVSIDERDVDVAALTEQFDDDPAALSDQEVDWLIHLREIEFEEMVRYYRHYRDELDE